MGALVTTIADRLEGVLGPGDDSQDDEALRLVQAESVRGAAFTQLLGGQERALPPLRAAIDGYNLHAGVTVGARDREGLERLCRYLCRPPVALDRLEGLGDGRVAYKLRRAWSDGTTAVVFTEAELVRRLVALIPPPRANQVRYHGVLSGRHAWKARIAPRGGRIAPRNKSSLGLADQAVGVVIASADTGRTHQPGRGRAGAGAGPRRRTIVRDTRIREAPVKGWLGVGCGGLGAIFGIVSFFLWPILGALPLGDTGSYVMFVGYHPTVFVGCALAMLVAWILAILGFRDGARLAPVLAFFAGLASAALAGWYGFWSVVLLAVGV